MCLKDVAFDYNNRPRRDTTQGRGRWSKPGGEPLAAEVKQLSVLRWIVSLVAIALLFTFGAMAASALAAEGVSAAALRPLVWALVTYLAANLFLNTRS